MGNKNLKEQLIEIVKNAKTLEELRGVFFTMIELDMNKLDMCEVLEEMKLSEEVLKEMNEEESIIKK